MHKAFFSAKSQHGRKNQEKVTEILINALEMPNAALQHVMMSDLGLGYQIKAFNC